MRGTIILENLSKEEIEKISSLGFIVNDDKIKIPIKKLEESLNFDKNSLKNLVEKIVKKPLVYKKDEKRKKLNNRNLKLEKILSQITKIKLKEYISENIQLIDLNNFEKIIVLIENLNENRIETLGNYGGRVLGNPHILNYGTSEYKQLVLYLKYENKIFYDLDLDEEKELLSNVGLINNPLNTYITIFGFNGIYKNGETSKLLKISEEQDINVNLSNILDLERVEAINKKVLIVENPNAYISIRNFIKRFSLNISLICTGGQLNQCAYSFLNKINLSDIQCFYSGDIDPEGILIAQNIKNKYGDIKLIGFNRDLYLKYKSHINLSETSIKKLRNIKITSEITFELIEEINKLKKPAYQELFVEEILEEIGNSDRSKKLY